jgi:hypothetical protein
MRRGLIFLLALAALPACSAGVPGFLGRDGGQTGTFSLDGDAPEGAYDPVEVPLTSAVAERGLHGVIIRAESVTPTQGYFGAQIVPLNPDTHPDENGILALRMTAIAPTTPQATGPERTRTLSAALFIQNVTLRDVKAVRVTGRPNSLTLPLPK